MEKIRIAVVGFGNVGKLAIQAVEDDPEMELAGIVEIDNNYYHTAQKTYPDYSVVTNLNQIEHVDVAILCFASLSIPAYASSLLEDGINTVDSYDLHGDKFIQLKETLHAASIKGNSVSISAAGWDPGTDSLIRSIFEIVSPKGITHTNFGPGMSMGHTVEVKKLEGVKKALSITMPKGMGKHLRQVFVELKEGYQISEIEKEMGKNEYFKNSEFVLSEVDDIEALKDYGHGVHLTRKGVSSQVHNQFMSFELRITNPAVTAQVMVNAARAALKQPPGNYSLLELPLIDLLPGNNQSSLHRLV